VTVLTSRLYRELPWEPLPRDFQEPPGPAGLRVERVRAWSLPGELHYPFFRGLRRALEAARPEIVHVHTYGTHQAAVARRFHRRTGVPFVVTAHYHPIWSIYGGALRHWIRGFYDRWLAAPIVGDAARLIVQTREEERLLRANGFPLPPVVVIPPGYAPIAADASDPDQFRRTLSIDGPFVLFVGRLASNKGLLELVDAFSRLAQHDPSAGLVLIGADGGMRPLVEARVREHRLVPRVRITGHIPDDQLVASAFRAARVFALPSEYEAFGLVLLEALAQGTPVVASRVGGVPEVLDEGRAGRLVPPEDSSALADALIALWDDESLRRDLSEYGRSQVVPRYSWERMVDQLETLYREVLGR
jgi:glycosyltransferase involved in cell wall biosynthesis